MSYIRCLCNPEGLYIWGDGKYVNITLAGRECHECIPEKIFDGLIKKFHKEGSWCVQGSPIKYKGATIEEVLIESNKKITKLEKELKFRHGNFKYRLSYKDWYIDMWQVTWEHVAKKA